MTAKVMILSALVVTLAPLACPSMPDAKETIVTEKDNGRHVVISHGSQLVVRLEASPGTGYGWQIVKTDDHIRLLGQPTFEKPQSKLAGGTTLEVFHFRAETAGTAKLELHYQRPWEKDLPATKTYNLEVQIK